MRNLHLLKNRLDIFILILIFFLGLFFRINNLSNVPPSPSLDEVSIGYNAYSIFKTGVDEYGTKFPLLLRAYDDWRPAVYVYLVIPFVKFFGLNVLSIRLPSAILSFFTLIAIYLLTREIILINRKNVLERFKNNSETYFVSVIKIVPLFTLFLFSISPWHIYISRLGHETNASFSFFIIALLFFLRFLRKHQINKYSFLSKGFDLVLSAIFFGLCFDAYQSTKIFIPLFLIILFLLFYKYLLDNKKTFIISILVGFIVVLPILLELQKPESLIRFKATSIFNSNQQGLETSSTRVKSDIQNHDLIGYVFDNRRFTNLLLVIRAYLSYFNPVWLFSYQSGEIFKVPDFGLFYIFELPLIILGFAIILRWSILSSKFKLLILLWIISAFIPGSITNDYPHAMRSMNLLPSVQIIESFGFLYLVYLLIIKSKIVKYLSFSLILITIFFFVLWFYHAYFVNFRRELSSQFQYGVIDAFSYSKQIENKYDRIVVANTKELFQSYMFYLFTNKYDPVDYLKNGGSHSGGFEAEHKINKYEFKNPSSDKNPSSNTLYIINPNDYSKDNLKIIKTIKFLDGTDAVWVAEKLQ